MDELRKKLDLIDEKMRQLFEERMDVVSEVKKYKLEHNLPVYDEARESFIIEKNLSKLNNEEYSEYYKEYILLLLKVSKDLQNKS